MAKKKMTCHKDNTTTKSTDHHNPQDASKKLSNLKSLNALLLKETVERRKEVKYLLESKKIMENELTRLSSEIEGLKSRFTQIVDGNLCAYLEKDLVSAFIESQVRGIADELDALKVEISEIEAENGMLMERNEGLVREKAEIEKEMDDVEREMMEVVRERNEMEMAKSEGDSEVGSLKRSVNQLQSEIKKEKETVDRLTRERDELKRDLDARTVETGKLKDKLAEMEHKETKRREEMEEAAGVIGRLKRGIEERDREKAVLKCEQLTKISELEEEAGAVKGDTTRKSFWTLVVASATTMVAVAMMSFAYASSSKGR